VPGSGLMLLDSAEPMTPAGFGPTPVLEERSLIFMAVLSSAPEVSCKLKDSTAVLNPEIGCCCCCRVLFDGCICACLQRD
jgi:hypothetical protein